MIDLALHKLLCHGTDKRCDGLVVETTTYPMRMIMITKVELSTTQPPQLMMTRRLNISMGPT